MVTLTSGPVTLDELNEQVQHASEVRYERSAETAAAWIERAQVTETRKGRLAQHPLLHRPAGAPHRGVRGSQPELTQTKRGTLPPWKD